MNEVAFATPSRGKVGVLCAASLAVIASLSLFMYAGVPERKNIAPAVTCEPLPVCCVEEEIAPVTGLERWSTLIDDHCAYYGELSPKDLQKDLSILREALEATSGIENPSDRLLASAATKRALACRLWTNKINLAEATQLWKQSLEECRRYYHAAADNSDPHQITEMLDYIMAPELDLVQAYADTEDWSNAEKHLRSILEMLQTDDPQSSRIAPVRENLGMTQCAQNKFSQAEKNFLEAARLSDEGDFRRLRCLHYAAQASMSREPQREDEKILATLVKSNQVGTDKHPDQVRLARYYLKFGQPQKARRLLKQALPFLRSSDEMQMCGGWGEGIAGCCHEMNFEHHIKELMLLQISSVSFGFPELVDRTMGEQLLRQANQQLLVSKAH